MISVPLQVVNKVEESKEKCYEIFHYLVSILHIEKFLMDISSHVSHRGPNGLRLSEFVQISEFFSIYITDICQTSESFAKSVNLK